ncbi:GNAT family N-acetyltransferase [Gordonia jinhuaensis]|uniref:N-acetyltransferase domain-containing protein n=1 Tax=Gordonia jinhuaensis TaxID=1517702 RepID=A0A916WQ84_9ACTN|nr:GNAT family N-acetyltransferase [Gordonia jinhuaensis]GGB20175.1 hypothetical protein GCM10011489_05370 [Gordonia jinhuaensis]
MIAPMIGDRVVVRFRLAEGAPADWRNAQGARLSDVTGVLVDDADPMLVERDGESVAIPRRLVEHVRLLSRHPVRNSDIRSLEYAAAHAWPGCEQVDVDGWFVRAGHGFTRRANSAVPLAQGARLDDESRSAMRAWYADRGIDGQLAVIDRLIPARHIDQRDLSAPVAVLTASLAELTASAAAQAVADQASAGKTAAVELSTVPDDAWVSAYGQSYRESSNDAAVVGDVVASVVDGSLTFASVRTEGRTVATGRAALTRGHDARLWLGISAVWTAPDMRRRGLARAVLESLIGWGSSASDAYLQVEADNIVAAAMYRRRGFGLHHTYGYQRL